MTPPTPPPPQTPPTSAFLLGAGAGNLQGCRQAGSTEGDRLCLPIDWNGMEWNEWMGKQAAAPPHTNNEMIKSPRRPAVLSSPLTWLPAHASLLSSSPRLHKPAPSVFPRGPSRKVIDQGPAAYLPIAQSPLPIHEGCCRRSEGADAALGRGAYMLAEHAAHWASSTRHPLPGSFVQLSSRE